MREPTRDREPMGNVIMLSGPIGAGKTTVARELVALWTDPLICIEGDRFWPFFARPKENARREAFTLVMRSIMAASLPFARTGYDVLLDFSVPPAFLRAACLILKDINLDFVLLRPGAAVCAERSHCREEGRIEEYDHGFYALFAGAGPHVVADDGAGAAATAACILTGLRDGRFRVDPARLG